MNNEAPGLIDELPGRYRPGLLRGALRVRLEVGDEARDVLIESDACSVEKANGLPFRTRIKTDSPTWARIHRGECPVSTHSPITDWWSVASIGHVPQIEHPKRTAQLLSKFFG